MCVERERKRVNKFSPQGLTIPPITIEISLPGQLTSKGKYNYKKIYLDAALLSFWKMMGWVDSGWIIYLQPSHRGERGWPVRADDTQLWGDSLPTVIYFHHLPPVVCCSRNRPGTERGGIEMRVSRLVRICCGWRLVSDAETTTTAVSQQTVGHVNRCHVKPVGVFVGEVNVFVCVCVWICVRMCAVVPVFYFNGLVKKFTSLV